ncbi:MAG: tetratricopeptide repeat protein, partial [Verrucomicrobiaceae bacterium]
MANPAETTPPPTDEGFDPTVFWIRHRTKIVLFLVLFLAAALFYAIYEYTQTRRHQAAAQAYAVAKTPDDYRKVISEYPSTVPAANAHLVLAEKLREEGKLDESNQILRAFIEKYPENNLLTGAYTSLATNLEIQGQLDEAVMHYQKVTTSFPTSFSAPVAWLGQARVYKAQGKEDEAKRAYETVVTQFAGTTFATEAARQSSQ